MTGSKLAWWCAYFALFTVVAEAVLSGLYIDNGVDQTVIHHSMTRHERMVVEHEILELLGLGERPRRSRTPPLDRSAPSFLLDVYKQLAEEHEQARPTRSSEMALSGDEQHAIDESDLIMTFQSKTVLALTTMEFVAAKDENIIPEHGCRDVMTEAGLVRGRKAENEDYFAFLGIPYADPPTGYNRFRAPKPRTPWTGVYEADRIVSCPQSGSGDEDCLVVNVFSPTKLPNHPLPVLFYIHGGAFIFGAGQTNGTEPLVNEDVIVVTINYRLGALGFLCLGIEEAPGNAGLKDQIAALKWVKNNIRNFGGDPENIIIYGMSAGGASVEFIILSQNGQGLFKRAIIESGSATVVWATDANPVKTALEMAEFLDFPNTTNIYELIDYYRAVPAAKLSSLNHDYYDTLTDGTFGFVPCVERVVPGVEPYITKHPYEILTKDNFHKVPVMFMFSTLEGLYLMSRRYYDQNYKERMEAAFEDFLPADLVFDTDEIKQDIAKNIKHFYFGNETVDDDTIMAYLNYFGDSLIMKSLLDSVLVHSKDNPAYLMEFMYKGGLGSYDEFYDFIDIAGHGDVLKHVILNLSAEGDRNKLAVARVAKLMTNFMKFGNPTPIRSQLLPILWPPVEPNNVSCLLFNDDLQIIEEPYWERKNFWDQLYAQFRRPTK